MSSASNCKSNRASAAATAGNTWKIDAVGMAALLGLSAAAYFLGAAPLLERHSAFRQQQSDLVEAHQKAIDTAQMLATAQSTAARIEHQFAASPLRLEPAKLVNERLALMTELAAECGAVLDDLQPGKTADGAHYGSLSIRVGGT